MRIAVVTFDRFNEIDSFVALSILNRLQSRGVEARLTAPSEAVTSMNGVTVRRQEELSFAARADAVLIGSGRATAEAVADQDLMNQLELDPERQWIGSQCSGALVLAKLGLLESMPACTDSMTRPALEAAGVQVQDGAFFSKGRVATAGGCLSAYYLAAWLLRSGIDDDAAREAIRYVAPVGEEELYIERAMAATGPNLAGSSAP